MREEAKLGVALAVAAAIAGAILCVEVLNYNAVTRLTVAIERSNPMTTVTSSWTSGGIAKSVTTTRREGESAEDFAARHAEEVAALLALFPRDP